MIFGLKPIGYGIDFIVDMSTGINQAWTIAN